MWFSNIINSAPPEEKHHHFEVHPCFNIVRDHNCGTCRCLKSFCTGIGGFQFNFFGLMIDPGPEHCSHRNGCKTVISPPSIPAK